MGAITKHMLEGPCDESVKAQAKEVVQSSRWALQLAITRSVNDKDLNK
jgi:hypothetical protein